MFLIVFCSRKWYKLLFHSVSAAHSSHVDMPVSQKIAQILKTARSVTESLRSCAMGYCFLQMFYGIVVVYKAHKPKFMVVNRDDLDILFWKVCLVQRRFDCTELMQGNHNLFWLQEKFIRKRKSDNYVHTKKYSE